jgi:hypothetical protein
MYIRFRGYNSNQLTCSFHPTFRATTPSQSWFCNLLAADNCLRKPDTWGTHQVIGHDIKVCDVSLKVLDIKVLQIPKAIWQRQGNFPTRILCIEGISQLSHKQVEVFSIFGIPPSICSSWVFPIDINTAASQLERLEKL